MAKRKYLISVSDSETNRILKTFSGTKRHFIIIAASLVATIMLLTYFITAFTPIKKTVPGYPSEESRQLAMESLIRTDSLERVINAWSLQMLNIRRIVEGKEPLPLDSLAMNSLTEEFSSGSNSLYADSDSLMLDEIMNQEKLKEQIKEMEAGLEALHFYPPVKGMVTQGYDQSVQHPYTDIVAEEENVVYSVLDGTVVAAFFDEQTGNNIMVQHGNDLLSVYKHNERLLKKTGEMVKAGDPIAIVGNTGKISTGPHLHFELWHKGEPVDIENYINF